MLFRKKLERSCSYCQFGAKIDDFQVICTKKGLRSVEESCRKFCYDPCKRIPSKPKAQDFKAYNAKDYSL